MYALNTTVSECLYVSLQMLEIALRNRFHACLSGTYGDDWFDQLGVITTLHQRQKITEAKIGLVQDGKSIESGRVVASLTFGFWTACLGNNYEATLWRPALSKAFPNKPANIQRKPINKDLTPIRLLRNRIAHHEPILSWDLQRHHANIMKFIDWLSPEARAWTEGRCRFQSVYDSELASLFKGT